MKHSGVNNEIKQYLQYVTFLAGSDHNSNDDDDDGGGGGGSDNDLDNDQMMTSITFEDRTEHLE